VAYVDKQRLAGARHASARHAIERHAKNDTSRRAYHMSLIWARCSAFATLHPFVRSTNCDSYLRVRLDGEMILQRKVSIDHSTDSAKADTGYIRDPRGRCYQLLL
jgi:hypothetical protein